MNIDNKVYVCVYRCMFVQKIKFNNIKLIFICKRCGVLFFILNNDDW